jgi:hypothetical protein
MGRLPQKQGHKGSQKWLQVLVNNSPEVLNAILREQVSLSGNERISWLSPVKDDDYAEYRDKSFLDRLGIILPNRQLTDFWPSRGPVWDGLAKSDTGKIFLVEAKAHIPEAVSSGTGAGPESLKLIRKSLTETKKYLGSKSTNDWSSTFYQYTNRLAHLYLLRVLNDIPVYLVFVYFLNDREMNGPATAAEWQGAVELLHTYLGIRTNRLSDYIIDVFVDVRDLR